MSWTDNDEKTVYFAVYRFGEDEAVNIDDARYLAAAVRKSANGILASKGVIQGTGAQKFSPGESVTRADFITLLVRTLELKADYTEGFDDVPSGSYYHESVCIARKLGIVKGTGDNKFNPSEAISRQDMMVMAAAAIKASGRKLENASKEDISDYRGASDIAAYAAVILYRILNLK